ncbi:metal-dependent hydrolase [Aestuariicella hydrocarbonica]|uniref:Metal-dependent hydrolase n=1 Tax=Pseudomaricurvus hydrocarbonicus TaxID=1470433 RepID=A0A9E5JQE8_9GAMM|nr:metal-dependent hydrolase [Aestuariicella hydrocarbonica]NHO64767.1 metal-dependent hydrolase [Aestuariicella hydrocarbonica]
MRTSDSELVVRKIEADFSEARIDWLPSDPELAQFWNAVSIGLPMLEGHLIRALAQAKKHLPEGRDDLFRDCELFCQQEANHTKAHLKFNEKVVESGLYPEITQHLDRLKSDYIRFDKEMDLDFCMHYAEGFETVGPILAEYFLVQANKRLTEQGVDLMTLSLWRWHLAEEYEHRCCAFNVVEALYGSYWRRIRGIIFATSHLLGFVVPLSEYMLKQDVEAGRVDGGFKGFWRKFRSYTGMATFMLPRVLKAFMPWYNPKHLKPPKGCDAVLNIASETLSLNEMAARAYETI